MRSRGSNYALLRRDGELGALRAGQRSVRLHLSARRPERPKPVTPSIMVVDTHAAALAFQRELTKLTSKMLRKKLFIATFTSKVARTNSSPCCRRI